MLPIPRRVLREALVNALMHRSYRQHSPVQIIRYANRIEIVKPGYSLKPRERLGERRSETRNPHLAAVLHATRFAETRGSGIAAMRRLMQQQGLVPPTFDSDREGNEFTARFLLHHFLDEHDLRWLATFADAALTDEERIALVFVREVGALDNATYRELTSLDAAHAGASRRRTPRSGPARRACAGAAAPTTRPANACAQRRTRALACVRSSRNKGRAFIHKGSTFIHKGGIVDYAGAIA